MPWGPTTAAADLGVATVKAFVGACVDALRPLILGMALAEGKEVQLEAVV